MCDHACILVYTIINVVVYGLAQWAKHIWTVVSRSSCDCKSRLPWAKLCRCLQPMCWERCSLAQWPWWPCQMSPMIFADHIWSQYTSSIMFNMYSIYIYIYIIHIYIYNSYIYNSYIYIIYILYILYICIHASVMYCNIIWLYDAKEAHVLWHISKKQLNLLSWWYKREIINYIIYIYIIIYTRI